VGRPRWHAPAWCWLFGQDISDHLSCEVLTLNLCVQAGVKRYVDTHMGTLSYTGLFVLQALAQGYGFGFDIMDVTRLPSGTVYPALRRLETLGLVRSDWETDKEARDNARPRRRYYELTKTGRAHLAEANSRYRAVAKLFPHHSSSRSRV
jgi:PadR family transcriptional regulator, regulatory protein PadR